MGGQELQKMRHQLVSVVLQPNDEDTDVLEANQKGIFSSVFYSTSKISIVSMLFALFSPAKGKFFTWLALQNRLPSKSSLAHRNTTMKSTALFVRIQKHTIMCATL